MQRCSECGCEISFRRIDGRIVPIGCTCRRSKAETVEVSGRSWQTTCPKCHSAVYFVRHNGGSAWFDGLGPPWDKHPCFATEDCGKGVDELLRTGGFTTLALVGRVDIMVLEKKLVAELFLNRLTIFVTQAHPVPGGGFPMSQGDLVGIDFDQGTLHLQSGEKVKVSRVCLARCIQCGHCFSDKRDHMARCRSGRINTCGICGQSVQWTMLSSHVASHRRSAPS